MSTVDVPDWTGADFQLFTGLVTTDSPDWTRAIFEVTNASPGGDFPDWTEAIVVTGSSAPPTPPVVGYFMWYDATQITGLSDGAALVSWPDESGNGRNLTVITGTPTYYSSTTAKLIHGHPVVYFNGDGSAEQTGTLTLSQPFTIFVIMRMDTSNAMAPWGQGSGTIDFFSSGGVGAQLRLFAGATLAGGAADTAVHVITSQVNGASSLVREDGTVIMGPGTAGTNTITTPFLVGAAATGTGVLNFQGPIGELLFYPSALTTSQMASVEAYLAAKWA